MPSCVVTANTNDHYNDSNSFYQTFVVSISSTNNTNFNKVSIICFLAYIWLSYVPTNSVIQEIQLFFKRVMDNFSSCSRVKVHYIGQYFWCFILSIKSSKPYKLTMFTSCESLIYVNFANPHKVWLKTHKA